MELSITLAWLKILEIQAVRVYDFPAGPRKDLADYYGRTEEAIQNYFQYIKAVKNFNI
jgi:hypothetical protein